MDKSYILVIVLIVCLNVCNEISADEWIKPDAWSRYEAEQKAKKAIQADCICPPPPPPIICESPPVENSVELLPEVPADTNCVEKELAFVFYKKFINFMFSNDKLEKSRTSEYFLRNLQFKIKESQVNQLKEAKDPRDIDGIVSDIVEQSRDSILHETSISACERFAYFYEKIADSQYLIYCAIICAFPVIVLAIKLLSKILRIPVWVVILGLLMWISFTVAYFECNEKLELEQLEKLMMQNDGENPCQEESVSTGFWSSIWPRQSSQSKCLVYMRKNYGSKKTVCDPAQVLVEVVAKLHLTYFKTFLEKILETFKNITSTSGYIETAIIGVLFIFMVYILIETGLKHMIYGFFSFLASPRAAAHPTISDLNPTIILQTLPQSKPNLNLLENRVEELERPKETLEAIKDNGENEQNLRQKKEDGSGDRPVELTEDFVIVPTPAE